MEITFDTYDEDKSVYYFAKEPLSFQSEYLNLYLQKGIEEMGGKLNIVDILVTTAQEITFSMFSRLFANNERWEKEHVRKKIVEDYFAHCGFGRVNLHSIQPKGGYIEAVSEHYAMAWKKHFGLRDEKLSGVSYFSLGFLCGAVEAIFDVKPGTFRGKQIQCLSKGHSVCKFEIYRGFKRKINGSPSIGKLQHEVGEIEDVFVPNGQSVIDAIKGLNLNGLDSKKGLIDQFDMTLTKQFANYMAMVEIKLLMQAKKLGAGGLKTVKTFLEKLGEENAYFTIGKMINSDYWHEYIQESVGKDSNSELYACLDVFTAFGCGKWQLTSSDSGNAEFTIKNNPETNSFLKLVGNSKSPLGFYAGGLLMGIMNMLDRGAKTGGAGIDMSYVNKLKKAGHHYEYAQKSSRMTGAELDVFLVRKT
ncbi:hypothetical protein [Reichenbachiella ulvae]|uniref:V4R domain-containing protein n=1 Tax=Reichenbachiella ulvae TaxID=2980104 RepID=A0ABT3CRA7_9BACT|nr:hypothetical protein [Reichenbachiella ulvae]MCV9386108.1 hypothetical protein [Reichenbachiella ulvae]